MKLYAISRVLSREEPPYIVIWTKLIRGWPLIVNGGCRYTLLAHRNFLDQVRILVKANILWNHEEVYATFRVETEVLRYSLWIEASNRSRGLRGPKSNKPEMLEFNPRTVQTSTIA